MTNRIISEKGEWTCPRCGNPAGQYACSRCGFHIYAGFFLRILCQAIDGSIVYAFSRLVGWLEFRSFHFFFLTNLVSFVFFRFYFMYFTGKWGQTPGKMAVKIKVIRKDGYEIRWSNAILRNIFETVLVILINIGFTMAMSHTSAHDFDLMTLADKENFLEKNMPSFVQYCFELRMVYAISEFFVLLMNKKKRAIHDFIAGTVIIRDPRMPLLPWKVRNIQPQIGANF
ncbi:MAG TPA: RDD family protein [bacterium]|nr:RDD family protein [bacterium]